MTGNFVCLDCHVRFWLGKAVRNDERVRYFAVGNRGDPSNSQRPELNRVLWKMLADHAGHQIRVILDDTSDEDLITDDFIDIRGDRDMDVTFEDYLKDWRG